MSNVRWDMAAMTLVASSKQTIATATTTSFDFGTPDDINTANLTGYTPGDRILVVLTASTAGSTSNLTWVIQDADDSSGSIGTPATAVTSRVRGARRDHRRRLLGLRREAPARPVRGSGCGRRTGTDSFVCHCSVWAVPNNA
jgi:hypothetical protein